MSKPHSWLVWGAVGVVLGSLPAAASPPDVPPSHWAARSVQSVTAKKIIGSRPDGKFHGNQPVTRYELAVALDRFITYIEAGRKPLHPMPAQAVPSAPPGAPSEVKSALAHLALNGFVPPASPLFHGTGHEDVTAQELADALAQVTIRLSDRSLPVTPQ